ncbi:hypothetical protein FBU30_001875 [Linnemannia zychae]|nr:hypothetical protein FBU30_001875 [Linnemannia zychae]
MTSRNEALEIPEILRRIALYLPKPDFTSLLQTCQSFHTILTPLLYNNLTLVKEDEKRPSVEAVQRYIHLIGALKFEGFLSLDYLVLGFKHLHSIHLVNNNEYTVLGDYDEIMKGFLKIIDENPALTKWSLQNPWPRLSSEAWKRLSSVNGPLSGSTQGEDLTVQSIQNSRQSRGLDYLSVSCMSVSYDAQPWFLRACADAKELKMWDVSFMLGGPKYMFQPYLHLKDRPPQVRDAQIAEFNGFSVIEQLEFLSYLVEARHIKWMSPARGRLPLQRRPLPTLEDIEKFIQSTTWPKIRSLDLSGIYDRQIMKFPDQCIAHILNCIPENQLEKFNSENSEFGPLSLVAIRRQFPCLQEIVLEPEGIVFQSEMIQEIMESCPKLRVLEAGMLSVGHIRSGKPWVCLGLKKLSVHFDLESDRNGTVKGNSKEEIRAYYKKFEASQRYVFEQVGRLTELIELCTSMPPKGSIRGYYRTYFQLSNAYRDPYWTLYYAVSYGLGLLANLKKLEKLVLSNTRQHTYTEDLEMMVEQWPRLRLIVGALNHNNIEMSGYFQDSKVKLSRYYE